MMKSRQMHSVVAAVMTLSILIVGCAEAKRAEQPPKASVKPPRSESAQPSSQKC
ncbi:hypothetical protein RJP21_19660 [Paenibacillus sp. VCA1]|nr:hypothetical protein [Paenibacillus sp. VCA1]MDR9855836.1 hypothetical protein [Paenibacillus sp. VCA1]